VADIIVRNTNDNTVQLAPQTQAALFWLSIWTEEEQWSTPPQSTRGTPTGSYGWRGRMGSRWRRRSADVVHLTVPSSGQLR